MTVAIVNRSWLSPVKVMTSKEIDVREREIKRKEREKTGEVSFTICQTQHISFFLFIYFVLSKFLTSFEFWFLIGILIFLSFLKVASQLRIYIYLTFNSHYKSRTRKYFLALQVVYYYQRQSLSTSRNSFTDIKFGTLIIQSRHTHVCTTLTHAHARASDRARTHECTKRKRRKDIFLCKAI